MEGRTIGEELWVFLIARFRSDSNYLGPGKRESTAPRRRNLAGDYFGFNLRKDREQKRDDFRKRVASATGITNPDLKKRRKTVRAFDAEGKGVGKGQYIREGKYVRKKQNATGDSDDHDTEDHVTQLELNGRGKGADRGNETEISANLRRISEHNSLEADVEMDDGNINTIAGNLKESTQAAEAYYGTNNTEVLNRIGSDLDIKMEDDEHELTENENGRRWNMGWMMASDMVATGTKMAARWLLRWLSDHAFWFL